jgi:ribonuclease HII
MIVCGVDEAGRGPLAGSVFAAAVILPEDYDLPGLNDSKKLSAKKREALFEAILRQAAAASWGKATVEEIERLNILEASLLAMRRAVDGLCLRPDRLLIDGNAVRGFSLPAEAVIKGDATVPCISAASVVAKVLRDRDMDELDKRYPRYGFAKHKGYGTAAHIKAIREFGPCAEHRSLFLRRIIA